jgi:alpha-N-arabinofuranosidase
VHHRAIAGLALASALAFTAPAFSQAAASPRADAPGRIASYENPVIPGFHPDPSVVRVGEDFYLVTSSFEFFPGVPVFHSRDLVHWKQAGHALTRPSQLPLDTIRPSQGIYAPTLRYHAGTFYMITTDVSGGGNFYVTATNPAGPWSERVYVKEQGGIDPSLFFDEDGTVYLTTNGGTPGKDTTHGIYQSTIDIKTGKLITPPRLVWRGTGGRYPEGPHLYRKDGRYYLLISEGGTEYGHMITVARGASPWGPFEACPRNPILTHRDTFADEVIQATGHADLVQDTEGKWWTVFLAFRTAGGQYHHLGRETFLAPVEWDGDGWPVVNGGKTVGLSMTVNGLPSQAWPPPPVRTEFDGPLGLEWNYLRNPDLSSYSLEATRGALTLRGTAVTLDQNASPTFVGRRQQHMHVRASTLLEFAPARAGEEAGLSVYHNPTHRYEIGVRSSAGGREVFVRQTIGPFVSVVTASKPVPGTGAVVLEVRATPTEYELSFTPEGGIATTLGRASTRYVSSEVAGGFTGVYLGLYATGGGQPASLPARFDWFEYEPLTATAERR